MGKKIKILPALLWVISFPLIPQKIRTYILILFGFKINPSARLAHSILMGGGEIEMGKDSFANVGCFFDGSASIYIGESVRIGPYVKILTGTHSYINSVIRRGAGSEPINLPVIIERGAWIGMGVIIMPGVRIGEGSIIGAGAVVLKSTESNSLYCGNPARKVKSLPLED